MARGKPSPNPTVPVRIPTVAVNYLEQERQRRGYKTVGDVILDILMELSPEFPWDSPPVPRLLRKRSRNAP